MEMENEYKNSVLTHFSLNKVRYDQSTFNGRLNHFLSMTDPRTLFPSFFFGMSLKESLKLLEDYKTNSLDSKITEEQLWLAKKIKDSTIHPDTGKTIPMPFRMSGYVPFGTPIVIGMLAPNQTLFTTIFWQWANQSQNALVNYCNGNASNPTPTNRLVEGYLGAIFSAVGLAVGLGEYIKRAQLSASTKFFLQRFIPFPAVATANVCNVFLMRKNEITEGIHVKDEQGNLIGTSKLAAKSAVIETALTRAFLPAPVLLMPPILMTIIELTSFLNKFPKLRLPVNALVCCGSFGFALPIAISMFPQTSIIEVSKLEPEFANQLDKNGKPIIYLYYNKGL
eukprot:TRINITY_DN944_c1_g1_i1.p1 TRINITY_DN944_c1_g1~~TRINITY_DN944_c1_g1_i1.p1  ORF type:complete len:338 (+),score=154.73 TRINITY_DN944_c1_g1_i1:87-1100(+)